eukprot:EG_transcript_1564
MPKGWYSNSAASLRAAAPVDTKAWPIRRLMYVSRATDPPSWTAERLAALGHESELWNKPHGVTGFLLCSNPFFLQVIEGIPSEITILHQMIFKDRRHTECAVVMDIPSKERLYCDWDMRVENMDTIALHPITNTLLKHIVSCFVGMWAYLPKCAANLLLKGKTPNKERPHPQLVVASFIHILNYKAILQQPELSRHLTDILDVFVDVCVRNVERTGGSIAKFINGSCMAYWPENQATSAVSSLAQIMKDLASLRNAEYPGSPLKLLFVACGVHHGSALLCNAGTRRADFTLLGDMINTCARISSLAVRLRSRVLLSSDVLELLADDLRAEMEGVGLHKVQGRDKPVDCYRMRGTYLDVDGLQRSVESFRSPPPRPGLEAATEREVDANDIPCVFNELTDAPAPIILPRSQLSQRKLQIDAEAQRRQSQDLLSLTYISWAEEAMDRDALEAIREAGAAHNQAVGITSCLFELGGLMAQTLEGPTEQILSLWTRIKVDQRHRDVVLIHKAQVPRRVFHEPLALVMMNNELLKAFPPLEDVLTQLARSFISLETYVPSIILRRLMSGSDPGRLLPVQVEVVMLATDICSFTAISECSQLEGVWRLCTSFIDCCTAAIVAKDGEVIKLIGDCVMAYFPPKCAAAALEASKDIVKQCAQMRSGCSDSTDCRSMLYCGVGLDMGPVVIAHNGSLQTRELTVTGLVSVRVQQVEALSRSSGFSIVVAEPVTRFLPSAKYPLGHVPEATKLEGVNCYGLLGTEWQLQMNVIKQRIQLYRKEHGAIDGLESPLTGTPNPGDYSSRVTSPPLGASRLNALPLDEDKAIPRGRDPQRRRLAWAARLLACCRGAEGAELEFAASPVL